MIYYGKLWIFIFPFISSQVVGCTRLSRSISVSLKYFKRVPRWLKSDLILVATLSTRCEWKNGQRCLLSTKRNIQKGSNSTTVTLQILTRKACSTIIGMKILAFWHGVIFLVLYRNLAFLFFVAYFIPLKAKETFSG